MSNNKKIFQIFLLSLINPILLIQIGVYAIDGKFLIYRDRVSNFSDLRVTDVLIIFILPILIFIISGLLIKSKFFKLDNLFKIYVGSSIVAFFIYGISFAIYNELYLKRKIENPVEISRQKENS